LITAKFALAILLEHQLQEVLPFLFGNLPGNLLGNRSIGVTSTTSRTTLPPAYSGQRGDQQIIKIQ
jgi:hypothetical protein